jgi:hypothetical protein
MHRTRKSSLVAILAIALAGVAAPAAHAASAAHGGGHATVIQLGTLSGRTGARKRKRYGRVQAIRSGLGVRLRRVRAAMRASGVTRPTRLPLRDSYARGPP